MVWITDRLSYEDYKKIKMEMRKEGEEAASQDGTYSLKICIHHVFTYFHKNII